MDNLSQLGIENPNRNDSLQAMVASHQPNLLVDREPFEDNTENGLRVYGIKNRDGTDTDNVLWQIQPDGGYPTTLVTHGNEFEFKFRVLRGSVTVLVHREGVPGIESFTLTEEDDPQKSLEDLFTLKSGDTFAMINLDTKPCLIFDQGNKPFEPEFEQLLPEKNGLRDIRDVARHKTSESASDNS